jgi:hypothetical protein
MAKKTSTCSADLVGGSLARTACVVAQVNNVCSSVASLGEMICLGVAWQKVLGGIVVSIAGL